MAETAPVRIHRIPFSTNVERVALAAGLKGISVEWVDHDAGDRSAIIELSNQNLVPVAEIQGEVVEDSTRIVECFERLAPEPSLYPTDPAARAQLGIFIQWFNHWWKRAPNQLDDYYYEHPDPDPEVAGMLRSRTYTTLPMFEALLSGRPFLLGSEFGAADVCAFPFLKYAALDPAPGDDDSFHRVLAESLRPADAAPRLLDWIERIDAMPRA